MTEGADSKPTKPKRPQPPGGSRKGIPNKITANVKAAIIGALDELGGKDYLVAVGREDPRTFCALLGRVLPHDVSVSGKLTLADLVEGVTPDDAVSG